MILHQELNPYKLALGQIYRAAAVTFKEKLLWDLKRAASDSRRVFASLENSHQGEKAVILCNGPSLLKTDFSLLAGVFTIGINKINLLFDQVNFRPSMIMAFDQLLNSQNLDFFKSDTSILKLLSYVSHKDLKIQRDDLIYIFHAADNSFCYRPIQCVVDRGHTVYIALQIAYFMGFEEVALVGADHNFPDDHARQVVLNSGDDRLHFHKDYHKSGTRTQNADRYLLDVNYRDARIAYESKGRRIVNATDGGLLNIFERMNLADFIGRYGAKERIDLGMRMC